MSVHFSDMMKRVRNCRSPLSSECSTNPHKEYLDSDCLEVDMTKKNRPITKGYELPPLVNAPILPWCSE